MTKAAAPTVRYFLDSEFMEDGKTIELISLAVVADDGREFYAEVADVYLHKANPWVKEHVIPHLWSRAVGGERATANAWHRHGGTGGLLTRSAIAGELQRFVRGTTPEFWGYFADYDWVALCQLYGAMLDLPQGWPRYCRDLKQFMDARRVKRSDLPELNPDQPHHALHDARAIRNAYHALIRRCPHYWSVQLDPVTETTSILDTMVCVGCGATKREIDNA